ncbi:MAG: AMP-binding protein, partial [Alphaproteobacteria bacterium]
MTDAPRKNPVADRAKKNRSEPALEMIRVLALELHPEWRQTLVVGPNSDLERDLGFDSLARAELVLRLNRELGIQLPDQIIADAATAADICAAAQSAAQGGMPDAHRPAPTPIALAESAAPEAAATLVDALDYHVRAHPERPHAYHWKSVDEQEPLTYGELDLFARIVAHGLAERGVEPGARVAIMLPTGLDYFKAFFGILYAGAIPVPIYPPFRRAQIEDHMRRQARILSNADATLLLTDQRSRQAGGLLYALVASLKGVHTVAELLSSVPLPEPVTTRGSDTALIQYTSGSTGDPKGVVLTHANLLANIRAMGNIVDASSRDIFVSWLPLYHDMGLIGNWLGSLYFGAPAYFMSPLTFIADPARWLWAIHNHRATISASPN